MSETQQNPPPAPASGKGRRQLVVIMTIALVSLGGSYLLFYFASGGLGWGTTNHGSFVQPHTTTSDLGWPQLDDANNWWLWVVADQCDERFRRRFRNRNRPALPVVRLPPRR